MNRTVSSGLVLVSRTSDVEWTKRWVKKHIYRLI